MTGADGRWSYKGNSIVFCELLSQTGCPDFSVCYPNGQTIVRWPFQRIEELPAILDDFARHGLTPIRVAVTAENTQVAQELDKRFGQKSR